MARGLAAVLAGLGLLAAGCSRGGVSTYGQASVVLVSIDTLRADRLALYGYGKGRTPHLDRLGREGIVFDDVYSHVPLTLPAHASLFTGLLPPRHEVRDNMGFRLAEGHRTLAERFRAAGFATGGAVSAYVLRSQTGIARGFEAWDDALDIDAGDQSLGALQRDGGVAVESLLRFVEAQGDKRFFAFLHLYEPHSPWAPPEAYRDLQPYDGDVAYADELLGRFLDGLRARGLYDRIVLAVTSDHGEGLGDHGEEEHGLFLYREGLHVPLVLRLPAAAAAGTRVKGPIAQADIAPSLLDLTGLAADGMDGSSLREAIRSGAASPRQVYSETLYPRYHFGWSDLYAVSDGRYRFIRAPKPELFDLKTDPGEKVNLAAGRAPVVATMSAWLERTMGGVTAPEEVDADTRERLAALGYVGAGTGRLTKSGDLPDPKDRIGAYEELKRGLALRRAGRAKEAVEQLQRVVAGNPLMADAWEALGQSLVELGREKEGMAAFDKVIAFDPLRPEPHLALARLLALGGRTQQAVQHAEIAAGKEPGRSFEILAQVMMDAKRPGDAAAFARRSLAADSRRVMSQFILGAVARQQGRCEEAVAAFQRAVEVKQSERGSVVRSLHFQRGDCLARLGREAEAEREFLNELQALPASAEARVGLAMLYRSQGRDEESRAALAGLITSAKAPSAEAYWIVVRTLNVLGDREAARSWAAQARDRFPADPRFR